MDVTRTLVQLFCVFFATALITACGTGREPDALVSDAAPGCTENALSHQYVVQWEDGHFSVEKANSREEFIESFIKPNLYQVRHAEVDQVVHVETASPTSTPAPTVPVDWGQTVVNAQAAWNQNIKGQGVIVAVVDSGVDPNHVQLAGQIAVNPGEIPNNHVDDDGNGFVDDVTGWNFSVSPGTNSPLDDNSHGTHVSGIIAANPAAGPVPGVAPEAKILPLKFMDSTGAGTIGSAILAIQYAVQMKAKVINASWGTSSCVGGLKTAISDLAAKNILFVAASGNGINGAGIDLNQYPSYPAAYNLDSQMVVGALTYDGFQASFSNYGSLVDLIAPGAPIYSTVPTRIVASGYEYMEGTSMATPFVAGAAALLWSHKPDATVAQIKNAIRAGVHVDDGLDVSTSGQLDVSAALTALDSE